MYHQAVLLRESIEGLNIVPGGTYIDLTFGGGGHAKAILEKLGNGRLIAFDQDSDAVNNKIDDERLTLVEHNFRYLKNFLKYYEAIPADGILADLGVSSHQFDQAERGFSMRFSDMLDMRMNRKQSKTATVVLNDYPADDLARIFKNYGELQHARALSRAIDNYRKTNKISTFADLEKAIGQFARRGKENQFFAQVMQALRIEINEELDALKEMLEQTTQVLKEDGRLVVISYHSLEDRLVKNFIRSGNFEGQLQKDFFGNIIRPFGEITKKPLTPSKQELIDNKRSRSAKLRIAFKQKTITP